MNNILNLYNKLFVVWIIGGGCAAFYFPQVFLFLKQYMELFFAITMFGIGMVLKPEAFKHILQHWWIVAIGVAAQFSIMPALSWCVSTLFHFSDEMTLGLILTGSAPGAMASNVLSYLAGADVAYSVSLTTVSTLISPFMTPLLVLFFAHTVFDIPFWAMAQNVCVMVVLPLVIGFIIKRRYAKQIEPFTLVFPALSTTFIVFICSLVIALNKTYIVNMNTLVVVAGLLLNIGGLVAGYAVGMVARFDLLKKRALSIEIGMQNAGLGSVLALKHFNERVALPAVVFVFICIFSASILVHVWGRKSTT